MGLIIVEPGDISSAEKTPDAFQILNVLTQSDGGLLAIIAPVIATIAVFIAGVAWSLRHARIVRQEENREEAQRVAASLHAELSTGLGSTETSFRGLSESFLKLAPQIRESAAHKGSVESPKIEGQREEILENIEEDLRKIAPQRDDVYEAVVGRLGLLPIDLQGSVIAFYVGREALPSQFRLTRKYEEADYDLRFNAITLVTALLHHRVTVSQLAKFLKLPMEPMMVDGTLDQDLQTNRRDFEELIAEGKERRILSPKFGKRQ